MVNLIVEAVMFFAHIGDSIVSVLVIPGLYRKLCLQEYWDSVAVDCSDLSTNKDVENQIQTMSTNWNIVVIVSSFVPAIFANLVMGAYADRYGRKINILIAETVLICNIFLYLFILGFQNSSMYLTIPFGILCGIFGGGLTALTGNGYAYLSDIVPRHYLTIRLSILSGTIGISGVVGNSLSGALVNRIDYAGVLLIAEVSVTVAFCLSLFRMKQIPPWKKPSALTGTAPKQNPIETVSLSTTAAEAPKPSSNGLHATNPDERVNRQRLTWYLEVRLILASVITMLQLSVKTLTRQRPHRFRIYLWLTLVALLFITMSSVGLFAVLTLFVLHSPFEWSVSKLAYYNVANSIVQSLGGIFAVGVLMRLGLHETTIIMFSLLSLIGRYLLIGLAKSDAMMYMSLVVGMFSGIGFPVAKSFLTQITGRDEVGRVFALVGIVSNVSVLLSFIIMNAIYGATVSFFPGFVFLVIAGLIFFVACGWLWVAIDFRKYRFFKVKL